MMRATVAILLFILTATSVSAAHAPAESPKASKVTDTAAAPAEAPDVAKKAESPHAVSAPESRKSGPAAAPPSKSSGTTSSPDSSVLVSAGDLPSPPAPLASVSPIADGPAEDPADAENSVAAALRNGVTIAVVAGVVATVIFA